MIWFYKSKRVRVLNITIFQGQELENQYGILVVEPDQSTDTPDPDNDHLFCVVYYPSVKNISDKENSTKLPLSIIIDMDDADTCGDDNDDLTEAENKFAYINGSSSIGNCSCSIADRAKRMQKYKAAGLITDRIISNKYNSSDFNISIEVFTLAERNAKQRIKEYQKEYPEGYFYVTSLLHLGNLSGHTLCQFDEF